MIMTDSTEVAKASERDLSLCGFETVTPSTTTVLVQIALLGHNSDETMTEESVYDH
jgi:hypothetical protein